MLYALESLSVNNMEAVVQALVAGLRFSHDLSNGGSLFATLASKSLLIEHLRVTVEVLRQHQLNPDQHLRLQKALAVPDLELDWSSAARRDLQLLRRPYAEEPGESAALDPIETTYVEAVNNESSSVAAESVLKTAPKQLTKLVPDLAGVLKAKQDLSNAIRQARTALNWCVALSYSRGSVKRAWPRFRELRPVADILAGLLPPSGSGRKA